MTALQALDRARSLGVAVALKPPDRLRLVGPKDAVAEVSPVLAEMKAEIVAELQRGGLSASVGYVERFGPPSQGSKLCERCRRLGTCYWTRGSLRVCGPCVRPDDEPETLTERERRTAFQRALGPLADVRVGQFRRGQPHDERCDCSTLTEHFKRGGSYDHWCETRPDDRGAEGLSLDAILERLQTLWENKHRD